MRTGRYGASSSPLGNTTGSRSKAASAGTRIPKASSTAPSRSIKSFVSIPATSSRSNGTPRAIDQGVLAFDVFGVKGTFGIGDWDETGAWPGGVNFLYGAIFVQDHAAEVFKSKVLELDPTMDWDAVPDL